MDKQDTKHNSDRVFGVA